MEKSAKKAAHLLDELALSSFNRVESAENYLREEGYEPDELANTMAIKIMQTISGLRNEWEQKNLHQQN